jgi:ABC-2 type transport system ATP-binding protein
MGKEKAIIFSTHILEEVEAVCTRAIIIDRGKIIADGSPEELKARASNAGRITLRATGLAGTGIQKELEKLSEVGKVEVIKADGDGIYARISSAKGKGAGLNAAIAKLCKEKGLTINELNIDSGRLDDLFREITKSDRED